MSQHVVNQEEASGEKRHLNADGFVATTLNADDMKPVSDREYPFWPPGSPQHSEELLKTVQRYIRSELPHNQIPFGNGAEIPLRQIIISKTQPLEGPGTNTNAEIGHYGSTLYDVFMAPYSAGGGV
jgi:hypothetical protein